MHPHSTSKVCSLPDCARPSYVKGFCGRHYTRYWRHGDPTLGASDHHSGSPEERFWAKVDKNGPLFNGTPCWMWTAYKSKSGYGNFTPVHGGLPQRVHRFAYELLIGPIPEGLTLDHLCRVRHCVNPSHLEPISIKGNVLRGTGISANNARKTHCSRGHVFDFLNTHIDRRGNRNCRHCANDNAKRRRKQSVAITPPPDG